MDELPRIARFELAGRAEIGVRRQGGEAEHRLPELGGALRPRAPRPELKAEAVADLAGPRAERECAPQCRLRLGARPEGGGERLVCLEVRRGAIEGAANERQGARLPAVALLCQQEVRRLQAVAG